MPSQIAVLFLSLSLALSAHAQIYDDYFGNGHTVGLKVSSSSEQAPDSSFHTIDGTNITPDLIGAARFLSNATLGSNYEEIERVSQIGINAWINEQMAIPPDSYLDTYKQIHEFIIAERKALTSGIEIDTQRREIYLGFAFYQRLFSESDVLRQRVALALSQIFVVSRSAGVLPNKGYGLSSYYDVLYQGAFGNFRDLLEEVTLHPIMGIFLSHFKNVKADISAGVFPDENFAREIMQLFTIGLLELNMDGSVQLDAQGNPTPTYDIVDVQELAKVFTGLSGGAYDPQSFAYQNGWSLNFGAGLNQFDLTVPLAMHEDFHETSQKILINGDTIPAGQPGLKDIDDVLDMLFNHDNTAPFISKRLIQHLVKSNPSPEYVRRVALTFLDNGKGVRGDLSAVITAILIYPEAIECDWIPDTTGGKLIQPLERFLNLYLAFDIQSPSNKFYFRDIGAFSDNLEQSFLNAPTVFNFFTPFYAESNYVDPIDLVSPEFQILNATSSIHYINLIENSLKRSPFNNLTTVDPNTGFLITNRDDATSLDLSDEIALYNSEGIMALLDRLDLLLCRGQLSQQTKDIIAATITAYESNLADYDFDNVMDDAIYFVMTSPDYIIQK